MSNGIYPKAVWLPGPENKTGYEWPNDVPERTGKGTLYHSAEGRKESGFALLFSDVPVSWTGTIAYDGTAYQHYHCSEITWHGGGPGVNCRFDGWEFEGRVGEPLTTPQVETAIDLTWWKSHEEKWPYFRYEKDTGTLHQHSWYYPTLCPSGRIPFYYIIERLNAMATELDILRLQLKLVELAAQGKTQELANVLTFVGVKVG